MKRFYFLSLFTLVAGISSLLAFDADAQPFFKKKIVNSGNAKAVGGNGGSAKGVGAVGGNGGSAAAQAGNIFPGKLKPINPGKLGPIVNSGNADAKGGNGGNAKGKGAKGGNGGNAGAQAGNIGIIPGKLIPIDPKTGKKLIPIDPGIGNGKPPKGKPPAAGGGKGGQANAGDANAKGGNGGNGNGKGAKGGNGGDAIAVSGDGNTIINGDNNTIIGKVVNNNISIKIGGFGGGGFGGGFGGGYVTPVPVVVGGYGGDGYPGTAIAAGPSETVITQDGSPAVAQGANGQDNVEEGEKEMVFTRRFVKVKNETDAPMKVFVQYRGIADKKWAWLPANPESSKDALVFDLKAGEEMYLQDKGAKLSASRVRIWGVAEAQNWFDYRDQDLWVVPEMDQSGEHRYLATEMRTFTFVFPKAQQEESK